MSVVISFRFRHPDRVLSPNAAAPLRGAAAARLRYKQIAAKQKVRDEAILRVRAALQGRRFVPASYKVVWYYKGVCPDADNCIARCKALLDGCAAAFGVDDRMFECEGVRRVHSLEAGVAGHVDLVFSGEDGAL